MGKNNDSTGITVWNGIVKSAMSMPGVKVDRKEFLAGKFAPYCSAETLLQAINTTTAGVIDMDLLDKAAKDCISSHTLKVTAISTAMGMPGGLAVIGTIPADLAQYYFHSFVLAQKLAYIYGFPSLLDERGNVTDETITKLSMFVGAMMGVGVANEIINEIARRAAKEAAKRIPRMALTKTTIYPIVKRVLKYIGVKVTKDSFGKGVGKAIPVLGGLLSGGLTLATFKPGANKLRKELRKNSRYFDAAFKEVVNGSTSDDNVADAEFVDVKEVI